ncbi:MAG: DUF4145 domain-containing protein [Proteobacteria bacterium]|nr:DUF4145 domain-containing protein [Pseudomonadota bacterium]
MSYNHGNQLSLDRCPHCKVARPVLNNVTMAGSTIFSSKSHSNSQNVFTSAYVCTTCGRVTMAMGLQSSQHPITNIWPKPSIVDGAIPDKARQFLEQAINSIHAPSGAVMLCASAVDEMLKDKGHPTGTLNTRIDAAAKNHLITPEMAVWAHEVRLDANDQRHADKDAPLPNAAAAQKAIEFVQALAEFLYVLPARVAQGRKSVAGDTIEKK